MLSLTQQPKGTYLTLAAGIWHYERVLERSASALKTRRRRRIMSAVNSNPKLAKTGRAGTEDYAIMSLSLAPADSSGIDICPKRSPACTAGCLGHNSGHSVMGIGASNNRHILTPVRSARIERTLELFGSFGLSEAVKSSNQFNALAAIDGELAAFARSCKRKGLKPAVRLNAFSDICWEVLWPALFTRHATIQFYDYTKIPARLGSKHLPANYHLTLSRSESNEADVAKALDAGHTVAMIFAVKDPAELPKVWGTITVIDGTADDMRFLDPAGCIVGLSWKGPTSKAAYTESLNAAIASGFAVPVTSLTH